MRKLNTQLALFPIFSSGGRLWIGMFWGQGLILKYFCADYMPPVLLKHFDEGLMSVMVFIHLSMTYQQNETLNVLDFIIIMSRW